MACDRVKLIAVKVKKRKDTSRNRYLCIRPNAINTLGSFVEWCASSAAVSRHVLLCQHNYAIDNSNAFTLMTTQIYRYTNEKNEWNPYTYTILFIGRLTI